MADDGMYCDIDRDSWLTSITIDTLALLTILEQLQDEGVELLPEELEVIAVAKRHAGALYPRACAWTEANGGDAEVLARLKQRLAFLSDGRYHN